MTRIIAIDHIVLKSSDVERSLAFYTDALGLEPLRVEEWRKGEVRFPSVRISGATIIDLFPTDDPAGPPEASSWTTSAWSWSAARWTRCWPRWSRSAWSRGRSSPAGELRVVGSRRTWPDQRA